MMSEKEPITMGHPPLPKGKEHLVYRDWPKLPLHVWEYIKEFLADHELTMLTDATYTIKDVEYGRGQMFVHPDGLTALNEAAKRGADKLFPAA